MTRDPLINEAHEAEFGAVAGWTADALENRDRTSVLAGACRGSGSPAALAWLAESLRLEPGMTLLDVGAGLGGASAWAAEHYAIRPIGIDPMVEASRGVARLFGQPAVTATAASLPLRSASVTAAWMLGVLDTLDDPDRALAELRRVLDDTGRVGILAYVASATVSTKETPDGNHFQPTGALETALEQAGFVVVDRVEGAQLPGPPLDWQLRQDRLQSELDRLHDGDPRWILAADQERAFARLLDAGTVTVVLLHAICV